MEEDDQPIKRPACQVCVFLLFGLVWHDLVGVACV